MPVTFQVATHGARKWDDAKVKSDTELLQCCYDEYDKAKDMIQSSFARSMMREKHITPSKNGLVYACFDAYSSHHHLTLKPEDVWFAILSQTGFFVNAHAEELRHLFVEHEGQKELEVIDAGSLDYADFGNMAERMTLQIQKNVVDPDLRDWVMPAFSTTTNSDRVVASILFMGAMQKYFSYTMTLACGIPSVTLLGEREDWEEISNRLPKLEKLGSEPAQFARLLQPILRYFLQSFDTPESPEVKDFWSKIAHKTGGSGPYHMSGWVTAFCFWDADGKSLFTGGAQPPVSLRSFQGRSAGCELDGVFYHRVNTDSIPSGFASVPVKVDDNGNVFPARMVAGSVGIQATSTADRIDGSRDHHDPDMFTMTEDGRMEPYVYVPAEPTEEPGLDSIQPVSGWWMFEVEDTGEGETPGTGKTKVKGGGPGNSCNAEVGGRVERTARSMAVA